MPHNYKTMAAAIELFRDKPTFYAKDSKAWRAWLQKNHLSMDSIWLIVFKKNSGVASIDYPTSVDDAICFGWIDSVRITRDAQSHYQYYARRNPKSNWSKVNKDKVARLEAAGLMQLEGQRLVQLAKDTGTWDALNEVEALVQPPELIMALANNKIAEKNFNEFNRSTKRGILEFLQNAKQEATRTARVEKIVRMAAIGKKAFFDKE
jgi:uncharacterized protein YdeI (YjbR/CyaY-like superfamily)